ncbi:hypothetical protein B0T26DRAFT_669908 [Lasiosphaeria miniovina]|uniref:Uncharacterized protein n=1 Tax=Lasiosphaeria miniovina TaxID=1954250 RepID=A0AA40E9N5_9PEZI|nr:uncharacterized protein B0T26DRAFT_669908 [Lasiosphaeria miniovina]KAK0733504.1 hypothetical protein B0T26DRAFT_669908 [Lasiosphaeria miniovina]
MAEPSRRGGDGSHQADVDRTITELKRRETELEDALQKLRAAASTSRRPLDSKSQVKVTMEIMSKAYRHVADSQPFLPSPGSVLPSLLALRRAHQTVAGSNEYMDSQAASLEQIQRRVKAEEANLRDQLALQDALEKRVQSLRDGMETRREMTQEQLVEERAAELKQQKEDWDKQTSSLLKDLDWFIRHHLGPMLAAEELGGPVVGELMEIEADDLSAGFSTKGKLKKAKASPDEDQRQRRIDEIWGGAQEQQDQGSKRKHEERDEASAASAEMRDLTEQLLNKLQESGGDSSAAYVQLARESAASRFLVRSQVAELHPKDATKLRLVNFGRELDD